MFLKLFHLNVHVLSERMKTDKIFCFTHILPIYDF